MSNASDRRKSSGGDSGGEGANWMDTYGDLVTLLLTFFVLLFANSSINAEKWQALVGAFTGTSITIIEPMTPEMAMENPIPPISTLSKIEDEPVLEPDEIEQVDKMLKELYDYMSQYISANSINAKLDMYASEYLIVMSFNDRVFFNSGYADILPESIPVLDHVAEMFREVEYLYERLTIEGHTDNVPINTGRYPSNMELSIDRALNVQRYLQKTGLIDPRRLKIGGYGEYDPIGDNDTVEGRALNRRVDFVVEGIRPENLNESRTSG